MTLKRRVRTIQPGDPNYLLHTTLFFVATNDLLNSHNNAVFHSSPTVKAQVKCIDLIAGDISDDLKKKITQKSLMIQQKWALAVGEKYDLTTNVKVMV